MEINKTIQPKKYILVFIMTCIIFALAFYISNYFGNKKIADIKATEDKISIDILSSETQYELLQESSCADFKNNVLSNEISTIGNKLSYAENQQGIDSADVKSLKRYYSLLEIKDYLLMKKIYQKCNIRPTTILYFYSNNDCEDCRKQGYVLTRLREDYPEVRVYTFDYDLDLNALSTLISINKIKAPLPGLVINDKTYQGFQDMAALQKIVPALAATSTTSSTSTKSTSGLKAATSSSNTPR